jgi:hypothetical protein
VLPAVVGGSSRDKNIFSTKRDAANLLCARILYTRLAQPPPDRGFTLIVHPLRLASGGAICCGILSGDSAIAGRSCQRAHVLA